jgi:hypothetical protein
VTYYSPFKGNSTVYYSTAIRLRIQNASSLRISNQRTPRAPDHRLAELKADYAKMSQIFIQEPPPLEEIIHELKRLEAAINSTKED